MSKIVWRDPENIAMLERLLADGARASAIGYEFALKYQCVVTKNAVIGIVHRLTAEKLITEKFQSAPCRAPRSIKRVPLKRLEQSPQPREVLRRGKNNQPEVVLLHEPVEADDLSRFNWDAVRRGQAKQLLALEYQDCKWPVHGDDGKTFLFCCGTRSGPNAMTGSYKSPYCSYHTHVGRREPPDPNAIKIHPSRRRKQGAGGVS